MSMCLLCTWYWWSFVSAIADWLSENRAVALRVVPKTSVMSVCSQSTSFAACVAATYSDSVVERDTISWLLALHKMVIRLRASYVRTRVTRKQNKTKTNKNEYTNEARKSSTKGCVGCEGVPTQLLANQEPRAMRERKLQR